MSRRYDFLVIGGGSAGFNAARVAASLGKRVAIVDGAKNLSGLCILRGCMPSKTLIYAAEVLHLARTGAEFGLRIPRAHADMRAVQKRKKAIINEFAAHRVEQLKKGKFDLIRSNARFVDANTVELDNGELIRSKTFLVATGSRVSVPPLPGLEGSKFWTSDDVLDLDYIPKSVIILGGGIVAVELAQFLRRVGTRVCIVQRSPALLRGHSREAVSVINDAFAKEGIEVHTGTKIRAIRTFNGKVSVSFVRKGRTLRRSAAHLFNALGREPEVSRLCLDAAMIKTEPNGRISTNKWQQTSAPNIYAAGDCCGPHEIVHVAIQQAELAARHFCGVKGLKPVDEAMLLSVIFTDPQIASIGWSEAALKKRKIEYLAASYPFNDHGKSILMNANFGYVKVVADSKTGVLLGAEIVGKDGGELIHCFTTPLKMGATVFDMLGAPWYHPTLSEIVTYPLEEIAEQLPKQRGRIQ